MPRSISEITGGGRTVLDRLGRPLIPIQQHRWSVEVRGDEVADITFAGVPLLRAIRPVIRDRDWNTVPARVVEVRRSGGGAALDLRFDDDEVKFDTTLTLTLTSTRLVVDLQGRALQACQTNRAGLVVLHDAGDAGTAVSVHHGDGSVEESCWPVQISPHQPFRDVTGFSWSRDDIHSTLTLSGDVFETEDQRNWTDASFKTYGTPLDRPFPVSNRVGSRVHQTVTVDVNDRRSARSSRPVSDTPDEIIVSDTILGRIPPISLGAALYPPAAVGPPKDTGYEAVLVELTGPEEPWSELLAAADGQATALGGGLDVRIVTDDPESVVRWVAALPASTIRIGAFDITGHISTEPLWHALVSAAAASGVTAHLVGGTRAHFTELNRRIHDIPSDIGELTFSVTPQMHASEVPHILDSLTTQLTVADNAMRLAAGRPVHAGPITLARRFNAVATSGPGRPETNADRATDPLLDTDLAAAWTVASVSALSEAGIASLCYFETTGARGIRGGEGAKPVAAVLDELARTRHRPLLKVHAPTDLAALAIGARPGTATVMVADLSGRARTVTVRRGSVTEQLHLSAWGLRRLGGHASA